MSTSRVDVGTPPTQWTNKFESWTSINVCFHGFADLTATRGVYVRSPEFSCFGGHQWVLRLYSGGDENSNEGYVSVWLVSSTNASIKIQWTYSVRNVDGKEVGCSESYTQEFDASGSGGNNAWCKHDFAKRSTLLNSLVDGSLVIEVRMKSTSTDKSITQFIPTNPFNKNMLELFMDEETADVVFEVGGEQQTKGKRKKTKTSATNFYAHRVILKKCAPTLYEMCKSDESGGVTTVSITDVTPEVFKHMLHYVCGGKLSDNDLKGNSKDIINACDKYGVVNLKLEAEAAYVESNEITMDNMMDNLLYADSKNLALLKEAVMDYIVANKGDIIGKVSFDSVPSSMITDVLTAVARGEESGDGDSTDYNKMRVGKLRKMLDEKGLDVDGSREAMIALLKEKSD